MIVEEAKHGDVVKVHYTGRLRDGSVFDSSIESEPLEFVIGDNEVIPAFEQFIVGMKPGDTRTITILADDAYGQWDEERLLVVNRDEFPASINPEVGEILELQQDPDSTYLVRITEVSETAITLDANHPLAGEDLTFDVELVSIG